MTEASEAPETEGTMSKRLARRILSQMGENGTPPEIGVSHINVGNESYLTLIEDIYIQDVLKDTDGSSFKLVQGTYGAGKSHFLYCVRDLAWRHNLLASFVTISPKETPLNKPLNVYQAVARQLEVARKSDESDPVRGIDDILRRTVDARVADKGVDDTKAWIDSEIGRAPIDQRSFRQAVIKYMHAVIDKNNGSERNMAAWLRGEGLPVAQAKDEGIYEVPSNDNGFSMLRSLVQMVVRLGYEGSVLLFDEAERRLSVEKKPTKGTQEAMDHLRELVDLCGRSELPRTLILYAVTPAFCENILPEYPALQQRLGSPLQYLSAHNPRAPMIDLEALDLDPRQLLSAVGMRLAAVFEAAYDFAPGEHVIRDNLEPLVRTVTEEQLEMSHRRLFVKLWIRLLDELRIGGARTLSPEEVQGLVRDEQVVLLEEDLSEEATFFGSPVPPRKG